MKLALKTLLVWLLVAALPMQGLAATIMVGCGPSHHLQAAQESHTAGSAAQGGGLHHRENFSPLAVAGIDAHGPLDRSDAAGKDFDLGQYSCSACAVCTVGTAITSNIHLLVFPSLLSSAPAVRVIDQEIGFIQGALERPPRAVIA